MDSNVDKAYHKEELRLANATATVDNLNVPSKALGRRQRTSQDAAVDGMTDDMRKISIKTTSTSKGTASGSLAKLISEFPPDVDFIPEDDTEPVSLALLPDELLVHVFKFLDVASVERFASISRKARILSLDSDVWRYFVRSTYAPPQIQSDETIEDLAIDYLHDYRRFFVEQPRLRLDGVYIAVCHYV